MKKIKMNHSNSDRIICVTTEGLHDLYYQPFKTKDRYWLARCNFSGGIFTYFRDKGRNMDGMGYGLTIREIYSSCHNNVKLNHLLNRIPSLIEYVIKEHLNDVVVQQPPVFAHPRHHVTSNTYEDEIAA